MTFSTMPASAPSVPTSPTGANASNPITTPTPTPTRVLFPLAAPAPAHDIAGVGVPAVAAVAAVPASLPARSDANTGADEQTLNLAGLPPQLRVLRHGAFYQLGSKNAGVLAPKAISFEDAGIDIEGVSRRLRTQKPQLSRIPEDVANPIASAVAAYLKVARNYGTVLSVARAVFGEGNAYVFVPNGPEDALKEQFLLAEEQARARVEAAKEAALANYDTWHGETRAILADFLAASHRRHQAMGRVISPRWAEDGLARLLAQVPSRAQIAAITVDYRDRDGDVFLAQLVREHRALDEKARLAARETVAYAERLEREDLTLQAARRRERYARAHDILLGDMANPFQEMATQLRIALRESLEQISASIERNGGRLTRAYKDRLQATLALFAERDFSGDREIEELVEPIRAYLATYKPPKKPRTGQAAPALGPTLIQSLTTRLKEKTYEEARAALLAESVGAALDF